MHTQSMLNLLRARECGYEVEGLDDLLHERWTMLRPALKSSIRVSYSSTAVSPIAFDTATGELLLSAGENELNELNDRNGAVAIYRRPGKRTADTNPDPTRGTVPLAMARPEDSGNGFATSAAWFPGDAGLFVLGIDEGRRVDIWDTERLTSIGSMSLGAGGASGGGGVMANAAVVAVQFPSHPLARSSLVAAACSDLPHATLLDLDSGTATHVLRAPRARAPVHNVTWSPLHPHHLTTIDVTGEISLFDIRRSGAIACLSQMSATSRKLPQADDIRNDGYSEGFSRPRTVSEPVSKKARSTKSGQRRGSTQDVGSGATGVRQSSRPLGLGCNWRPVWDRRHGSLHSRRHRGVSMTGGTGWSAQERARTPSAVIRYTWDGSTLVSCCGRNEGFYTHDVLTGCLLSSLGGIGTFLTQSEPQGIGQRNATPLLFEIARDNEHVIATAGSNLCVFDMKTGALVHMGANGGGNIRALAVHPIEEEVYTSVPDWITCWAGDSGDEGEDREYDRENYGEND